MPTEPAVALLQALIRNACVNEGTVASGHEHRSVATLQAFLGMAGEVVEAAPGRASLVVRLRGTDREAPALLLLGHLDVVPPGEGWRHDPFGGELIDGEVWGRGALDMLYLTASYAAVVRRLVEDGTRLRGDLVLAAVADEEAGGGLGTEWIVEHRPELLRADGVLSESGGVPLAVGGAVRGVTVTVGEKGGASRRLELAGRAGHAATPRGADSALLAAAEAALRIAGAPSPVVIDDVWPQYVAALGLDAEAAAALIDPARIDGALEALGGLAGLAHAVTRTTFSPTVLRAGEAMNVIPGSARLDVDARTLPGVAPDDVDAHLRAVLGDLAERTTITRLADRPANRSSLDTALYRALADAVAAEHPGARAVPVLAPGGSDGRFLRAAGVPAYGFGVLSDRWDHALFRRLVHSVDERIDVASVEHTVRALHRVVLQLLG